MKQYFTLAPPQLMHEMFDRAFDKYQDGGEEAFLRESCLDILQAMLTYQVSSLTELSSHTKKKDDLRSLQVCVTLSENKMTF